MFGITGRKEREGEATKKNLRNVGYETWEHLYMHPGREEEDPYGLLREAATYKTTMRWKLSMNGHRIVLNVGDQLSDLLVGMRIRLFNAHPWYTFIQYTYTLDRLSPLCFHIHEGWWIGDGCHTAKGYFALATQEKRD